MKKTISFFICFTMILAIIPVSRLSAQETLTGPSYLFAIDAGHGGGDPGSTRIDGKYECNDTEKVANEVIRLLNEQGQRTVLIDRTLATHDRPLEANKKNADYLISLHRDASTSSSARGISIYTHEPSHKQRTQQPEKDYAPAEHSDKHQIDQKLVNNLKTCLTGATAMPLRGVYYGSASAPTWEDYFINRLSNMPSCIIELGFGTNAEDNKIFDAKYKTLAAAIVKALLLTAGLDGVSRGKTGQCEWLVANQKLTVAGNAATADYTASSASPWSGKIIAAEILKGVTAIGNHAFYKNAKLKQILIPATVTKIGKNAFDGCSALTDVYYGGTEEQWNAIDIHAQENAALTGATIHYNFETYTGLLKVGGIWYYYKNGVINTSNTLFKYYNTWYHVKDGVINFKEGETLVKYQGTWYHVKDGVFNPNAGATLVSYGGTWYYCNKGVAPLKGETLIKYHGTWYHVKNGVYNPKEKATLVQYGKTQYYCNKGVLPLKGETLVKYQGAWYHVKKGVYNPEEGATLVKYNGTWYYCKKGMAPLKGETLVKYYGTWYHVKNGIYHPKEGATIVEYYGTRYYCNKGCVDFRYTGSVVCEGQRYWVVRGVVQ